MHTIYAKPEKVVAKQGCEQIEVFISNLKRAVPKHMKKKLEKKNSINKKKREHFKKESEFVLFVATTTNYFFRPRTIYQMAADFSNEYSFEITAERINSILRKIVVNGILKAHKVPYRYGFGYKHILFSTVVYYHPDLDWNEHPEQIAGYNWMPTYIF